MNSPTFQRKDPIKHNGVVQEREKDFYKPSKNNACATYTDYFTADYTQDKFPKKAKPVYAHLLNENDNAPWKPGKKTFEKKDQLVFT